MNVMKLIQNNVQINRKLRIINKTLLIKKLIAPRIPNIEKFILLFDETTQIGF